MRRERFRRRVLYAAAACSWMVAGQFAVMAIVKEDVANRVLLMFSLVVAGCLCTAALFAAFVAPMERVYRHGYEAGQRATGCSMFRPMLMSVDK